MIRIPFTLRGASASALGLIATQLVAFALEFGVARRLGASGLGTLAIGLALSAAFSATIATAFSTAASAHVARSHELGSAEAVGGHLRLALRLAVLAAGGIAILLIIVADALASLIGATGEATAAVIRIFALAMPFQALGGVGVAVALALSRPSAEIVYRWLEAAVRAIALPALVIFDVDVTGVAVIHLAAAVVSAPVGLRAAFGAAGPVVGSVRHELTEVLSLAGWQTVTTAAWLAARRLDVVVVSSLLGAHAAGGYRLASVLASLAGLVMLALQPVFYPVAARRFASLGPSGLGDHYRRVTRFAMISSAPIAALLVYAHAPLVAFFGAPFVVAGGPLVILAVGQAILAGGGHSTTVVQVAGARRRAALNAMLGAGAQLGALILLAPLFGIAGASVAALLGVLTTHVLQMHTMRSLFRVTPIDARWVTGSALVASLLVLAFVARLAGPIAGGVLLSVSVVTFAALALRLVVPAGERDLLSAILPLRQGRPAS